LDNLANLMRSPENLIPMTTNSQANSPWRSPCPVNISLELVGDKWALLVLRDILFKGFKSFKEFSQSKERIATNILASRLKFLTEVGLLESEVSEKDARVIFYKPTSKGLDLIPVIVSLVLWVDKYEKHSVPKADIEWMKKNTQKFIAEIRAKFE
jgi:DNA-binding HxlR family transcriptional regulator